MSSPPPPSLFDRLLEALQSFLFPWSFMLLSASFLPGTLLSIITTLNLGALFSWDRFQSLWFGRFWSHAGPLVRAAAESQVIPLLSGRISRGQEIPSQPAAGAEAGAEAGAGPKAAGHPPISGTVLEVGPGSGMWVSIFSSSQLGKSGAIRKVYGVEPNATVHPLLREQIAAAGLQDTYEIIPFGIESLAESGRVPKESVDCIFTVLCLCSIPDPQRNIAELYGYLKPGGRWYVYEHVRCWPEQGWGMRMYQSFMNLIWPHFIGGCEMCRDTPRWLQEAGPWSEVDLASPAGEPWYFTMPHVIGVLTK